MLNYSYIPGIQIAQFHKRIHYLSPESTEAYYPLSTTSLTTSRTISGMIVLVERKDVCDGLVTVGANSEVEHKGRGTKLYYIL